MNKRLSNILVQRLNDDVVALSVKSEPFNNGLLHTLTDGSRVVVEKHKVGACWVFAVALHDDYMSDERVKHND